MDDQVPVRKHLKNGLETPLHRDDDAQLAPLRREAKSEIVAPDEVLTVLHGLVRKDSKLHSIAHPFLPQRRLRHPVVGHKQHNVQDVLQAASTASSTASDAEWGSAAVRGDHWC